MKIFDAHIHTQYTKKAFKKASFGFGIDFSKKGLEKEMREAGVEYALSISNEFLWPTPIGLEEMIKQQNENSKIRAVCAINPNKISKASLQETEEALKKGKIIGLKIFLGYFRHQVNDKVYRPFFKLAEKYKSIVIFHTGDTYATSFSGGLLKFAHPLAIDEIANKFSNTTFILAHAGNPWFFDAGAVAYKNKNIYLDLSGLDTGISFKEKKYLKRGIEFLLEYVGSEKLLYGSDWPLVSMKPYLKFIKSMVPKKFYKNIFFENAWRIFGKYYK